MLIFYAQTNKFVSIFSCKISVIVKKMRNFWRARSNEQLLYSGSAPCNLSTISIHVLASCLHLLAVLHLVGQSIGTAGGSSPAYYHLLAIRDYRYFYTVWVPVAIPARQATRMDTVPAHVDWRACTATPLSEFSLL